MIIDKIENIILYKGILPQLDEAIDLACTVNAQQEAGKYEINDKIFYTINKLEPKKREEKLFETHKEYIDLQLILDGDEIAGFANITDCVVCNEYDPSQDAALYSDTEKSMFCHMQKGWFYIVFPQDAHMPCCKANSKEVAKAIFKVKL